MFSKRITYFLRTWDVKDVVGDWILISESVKDRIKEGSRYFLIFLSTIYELYKTSLHLREIQVCRIYYIPYELFNQQLKRVSICTTEIILH